MKLLDGYGFNIGDFIAVYQCKLFGLKSHDGHILMQQILHVLLRGILPEGPWNAIFRISKFFNELCQKGYRQE